jgi:histidinol-phosphate aminotransferase
VNTFAQNIAIVALEDQAFIEKCKEENQKAQAVL